MPPGRGSAAERKFLAPPYYSQRAVFASPWSAFFIFVLFFLHKVQAFLSTDWVAIVAKPHVRDLFINYFSITSTTIDKLRSWGWASWPLKICRRGHSMLWLPKNYSFIQNCCWITLQVSHYQGWKTYVKNGRWVKLIFRNAWNRLMAWPDWPWRHILRQICATASNNLETLSAIQVTLTRDSYVCVTKPLGFYCMCRHRHAHDSSSAYQAVHRWC